MRASTRSGTYWLSIALCLCQNQWMAMNVSVDAPGIVEWIWQWTRFSNSKNVRVPTFAS
jgi:hypothetical protein